jgi:hypothetical protein
MRADERHLLTLLANEQVLSARLIGIIEKLLVDEHDTNIEHASDESPADVIPKPDIHNKTQHASPDYMRSYR